MTALRTPRSPEEISEIIVRSAQAGEGFRAPILRAARDRRINLLLVAPGALVPAHVFAFQMPTLIVLMDDQPAATGPEAWPQARRLLRWARGGIFHAAAGLEQHYAIALGATLIEERALLVEMEQRHLDAWSALRQRVAPKLSCLAIKPTGGEHPIAGAPAGETVQ